MCINIQKHTHVHVHTCTHNIHTCIFTNVHTCAHIGIHMFIHAHVYTHVYACVCIWYICTCVRTHVYIHAHSHIHRYTHIHKHTHAHEQLCMHTHVCTHVKRLLKKCVHRPEAWYNGGVRETWEWSMEDWQMAPLKIPSSLPAPCCVSFWHAEKYPRLLIDTRCGQSPVSTQQLILLTSPRSFCAPIVLFGGRRIFLEVWDPKRNSAVTGLFGYKICPECTFSKWWELREGESQSFPYKKLFWGLGENGTNTLRYRAPSSPIIGTLGTRLGLQGCGEAGGTEQPESEIGPPRPKQVFPKHSKRGLGNSEFYT